MELPIGVIDNDNSTISRRLQRELNSMQGVQIYKNYANYVEAREAMQKGEIYGFIELPANMYADILSNRRPKIGIYSSQAFMIPGTLAYKNFLTLGSLASGAVQREVLKAKGVSQDQIMGKIQPIVIDNHYIGNPWSNYGVYLGNVILPGILQLCVLLMTIFAIGYELKVKSGKDWLAYANGSIFKALIGKLLPYSIMFIILGITLDIVLYKIIGYPLQGSIIIIFAATILLVFVAQAIGVFMIGLFPVLRDGVSFAALYGVLGISLAGMTFPLESMPGPVWGIGQAFPLRHYYLIYVHDGMMAGGFASCWLQFLMLGCFLFLPFIIIIRLKNALIKQNYPLK